MKIAFDKVNVTPNQPCFMAGYSRREKSQGVLDPIEINTVAAEIGNEVYILGILDSIMVEESFCTRVRERVSEQLGLSLEHITVSAIHTHSAPSFFKMTFEDNQVEEELTQTVQEEMGRSMIRAYNAMEECEPVLEKTEIQGLYGNRNVKDGVQDKRVYLFGFYNKEKKLLGALFNISAHPTILDGSSFLLSADLLGHIRGEFQQILGCPVAVTNGCCGDVSTRFYRRLSGREELEFTARQVVEQFMDKKKACPLYGGPVESRTFDIVSHFEARTDEDWRQMSEEVQHIQSPMKEFLSQRLRLKESFGAYDLAMIGQLRLFGNVLLVVLPGDVLSGFGNQIKNAFPGLEVVIICYSNTYCNYLVPREEYGKYFETYNSRLARGEADRFIEEVIRQAKELIEASGHRD